MHYYPITCSLDRATHRGYAEHVLLVEQSPLLETVEHNKEAASVCAGLLNNAPQRCTCGALWWWRNGIAVQFSPPRVGWWLVGVVHMRLRYPLILWFGGQLLPLPSIPP